MTDEAGSRPSASVPQPTDADRLDMSTAQVARRLGVSVGTVRRWADAGHLPTSRTPGGQRRFSAERVEAFLAMLSREGSAAPRRED